MLHSFSQIGAKCLTTFTGKAALLLRAYAQPLHMWEQHGLHTGPDKQLHSACAQNISFLCSVISTSYAAQLCTCGLLFSENVIPSDTNGGHNSY